MRLAPDTSTLAICVATNFGIGVLCLSQVSRASLAANVPSKSRMPADNTFTAKPRFTASQVNIACAMRLRHTLAEQIKTIEFIKRVGARWGAKPHFSRRVACHELSLINMNGKLAMLEAGEGAQASMSRILQ